MSASTLISRADISKIDQGFSIVKANSLPHGLLLSNTNQLACNNPAQILKNHIDGTTALSSDEVKEYTAISTLGHTIDGWSYISNSIQALLSGEPSIAIHLAYYAELRAALGFLATEGILLLNFNQACVDSHDALFTAALGGTHKATWNIIREWVANNTRSTNVLKYFTYKGKSFEELNGFIPYLGTLSSLNILIIKEWLKTWCFDIQNYEFDKEGRNYSSYNANLNRSFNPITLKEKLESINEFWSALQPGTDSFDILDRYLFSLYLTEIYSKISSATITKEAFLDKFFQNSGMTPDIALKDIFINNKKHLLLQTAIDTQIDPVTNEIMPLTIIARALLFLRFCSGANSYFLKKHNISRTEINFYIEKIGSEFGIWDIPFTDLKDLWIDIEVIIQDFQNFFTSGTPVNIYNLRKDINYFEVYTQFSRVSLWGLGI